MKWDANLTMWTPEKKRRCLLVDVVPYLNVSQWLEMIFMVVILIVSHLKTKKNEREIKEKKRFEKIQEAMFKRLNYKILWRDKAWIRHKLAFKEIHFLPSIITATPDGWTAWVTATAICFVNLSCTCNRREKISTILLSQLYRHENN